MKYWDKRWQAIVFNYVDRIISAGFDGVYMDIIDAYEYWGPGGESGVGRASAANDMIQFVESIAHYARVTRHRPNFGIFVQNGAALGTNRTYLRTVDGIGQEDTWYNGNTPNDPADIHDTLANLNRFKRADKLVMNIDYVTQQAKIDDFYQKSEARGFVPYATVRDLDRLTINPRHEPV